MADRDVCSICNKAENLLLCIKCKSVSYCGREHQKQDWKEHKKLCKRLQSGASNGSAVSNVTSNHTVKLQENGAVSVEDSSLQPTADMDEVLEDIGGLSLRAENPQFMPQWVSQNSLALNISKEFSQREEDMVPLIAKNMPMFGICVIDHFLKENIAEACLGDVLELYGDAGSFKAGQVIQPGSNVQKIRGDKIRWLDGSEGNAKNLAILCGKMDTIISKCNSKLGNYKITQRTRAMLACYPGNGAAYQCHIDNPTADGRCVTAIYYLNKGWQSKEMGGVLRIYPKTKGKVANVEPKFNRLLLFYSDSRNPHEVLPAYAKRFAVTIWYFDEEERSQALATWAKGMPRE